MTWKEKSKMWNMNNCKRELFFPYKIENINVIGHGRWDILKTRGQGGLLKQSRASSTFRSLQFVPRKSTQNYNR